MPGHRSIAWLVCAPLLLLATAGCLGGDESSATQATTDTEASTGSSGGTGGTTTVPQRGVLLTVTGAVGLVFGEQAFEVGVDDAEAVLVVSPGQTTPMQRGTTVRVTGVVEEFDLYELRKRGAELNSRRMQGFEGRSALIAIDVQALSGDGAVG